MGFSYNTAKLSEGGTDRMRLELGDTDGENVLLQDEELEFFLTETGSFYRACASAAYTVARKFAREVPYSVGPLKLALDARAREYRAMADQFKVQAEEETEQRAPMAGGLPDPGVGQDFYRGMHDFPGTSPCADPFYSPLWGC